MARRDGIENVEFCAHWERLGREAGPIRNQRMLDEGKPDLVVAFPGGRGTAAESEVEEVRMLVLLIGVLGIAAFVIVSRWQIGAGGEDLGVYRLDRRRGALRNT